MFALKQLLIRTLRDTADKIETDTCELTEQEASQIMEVLLHVTMSKETACSYLGLSRSKFDELIRDGKLPKGRKRRGFKELVWYRDELDNRIHLMKIQQK